ncbi:MAG: HhH-GPD family protein [Herbinix sp.]|nr:HhH-GPD family protein [Herbinix sp.]
MEKVRTKIFEYGDIIPDLFPALIFAVIGQQISIKAARTIWTRMQDRFAEITPEFIAQVEIEEIAGCGMQSAKAKYIRGIAETVYRGDFDLECLYQLSDKEAIKKLSTLNGIGAWTAEMLLLNCMERPDIISYGDIAIRRGIMMLYGLSELTKEEFVEYKKWRVSYE